MNLVQPYHGPELPCRFQDQVAPHRERHFETGWVAQGVLRPSARCSAIAPVDRFPQLIKPLRMLAPDHLNSHAHAFVADEGNRTGNEAADVTLILAAE
jgi:hypothetical protein